MRIVPSKDQIGPHSGTTRLPLTDRGLDITGPQFEENVAALIKYMEFFSDMSFEISVDEFPKHYQKYLVPLLSIRNIHVS